MEECRNEAPISAACKPTLFDGPRYLISGLMFHINNLLQRQAFRYVRWSVRRSNLLSHADIEFEVLGWPGDCEMQSMICENVKDLLAVLASQGHSGSSAPYAINMFKDLAMFAPISPITGDALEWSEIGDNRFQNKRCSALFKDKADGDAYYLNAIVWRTQEGVTYAGMAEKVSGERVFSRQVVKFPFTPKTFYVDVIEEEVAGNDWELTIKDESQLDAVFEHYEKK